jgi:hypothetical protein
MVIYKVLTLKGLHVIARVVTGESLSLERTVSGELWYTNSLEQAQWIAWAMNYEHLTGKEFTFPKQIH